MAETPARDAKLVQLLNEAYTKEKQLEVALSAHMQMTTRDDYAKRLKDHLKETKSHASQVSKRIKQLGGTPETVSLPGPEGLTKAAEAVSGALGKAKAAAQGPLHAVRGSGEQERMLQNARTEYQEEAWEIATYTVIDALATAAGDKPTAKLARDILRQEERMQQFLGRCCPSCPRTSPTTRSPSRRSTDPGRAGRQRIRSRRARPAVPRRRSARPAAPRRRPPARRPRPAARRRAQARRRRPEGRTSSVRPGEPLAGRSPETSASIRATRTWRTLAPLDAFSQARQRMPGTDAEFSRNGRAAAHGCAAGSLSQCSWVRPGAVAGGQARHRTGTRLGLRRAWATAARGVRDRPRNWTFGCARYSCPRRVPNGGSAWSSTRWTRPSRSRSGSG